MGNDGREYGACADEEPRTVEAEYGCIGELNNCFIMRFCWKKGGRDDVQQIIAARFAAAAVLPYLLKISHAWCTCAIISMVNKS